jgi:hypothetical protein
VGKRVLDFDGKPGMMLGGAADCRWPEVEVMGRLMEREEVLADPRKAELFHLADHIWVEDRRFSSYFDAD